MAASLIGSVEASARRAPMMRLSTRMLRAIVVASSRSLGPKALAIILRAKKRPVSAAKKRFSCCSASNVAVAAAAAFAARPRKVQSSMPPDHCVDDAARERVLPRFFIASALEIRAAAGLRGFFTSTTPWMAVKSRRA